MGTNINCIHFDCALTGKCNALPKLFGIFRRTCLIIKHNRDGVCFLQENYKQHKNFLLPPPPPPKRVFINEAETRESKQSRYEWNLKHKERT